MRGFLIGILCLVRLTNAGINLMLTGSRHYISDKKRTCTTQESCQLQDGSGEDVEIGDVEMEMDFAGKKVEDSSKKIIPVEGERQTFVSEMTKETVDAAT